MDDSRAKAGYPLTPGITTDPIAPDLVVSGYVQAQYENHQDSVDQLRIGGAMLNQDRFLLRRTRLKLARDWQWAQVLLEVDGNTVRGPAVRFQKIEGSLVYGRSRDKDQPPIAQLTIGQFDLPFGFEVPYVPKARWFMERTQGSRALYPGEPDVGVRFSGGYGFARYALAITNGEPLDEKSGYALQDPNGNKDVTARIGAEAPVNRDFVIAGGISYNHGKGFHPNTDPTKAYFDVKDLNGNGKIDNFTELSYVPAISAQPAKNFDRWAVGADLELLFRTSLGWTMVYGEVVAASNLDRGLYVADPVLNGSDVRELSYYIAATQEFLKYGIVGLRYDHYDPNADLLETRRNKTVPISEQIDTVSPIVGATIPGRARLLFQYDFVKDFLGRDRSGVPADLKNNQWTLRLQVNL